MKEGYSIRVIQKPQESLSEPKQQELVEKLIPVARSGFGTLVGANDIKNHVLRVNVVYVATYSKEPVGFGSFDHLFLAGKKVLYLNGVVFAAEHQRKGLMGKVIERAIAESDCEFIVTRTQNPVIYVCLSKKCRVLYPNSNTTPPEPFRSIAISMAKRLKMKRLNPNTLIEIGTYGGYMTATKPCYQGKSKEVAELFIRTGLCPARGDAAILVGELRNPLA